MFVAKSAKLAVPATAGVPVIMPARVMPRPAGSAPDARLKFVG